MKRARFLRLSAAISGGIAMTGLSGLARMADEMKSGPKMPVLFVGHGNPMNAIEDNEFSRGWKRVAEKLPRPTAILVISAHWETRGTFVTAMEKPRTIYDFSGFPPDLYAASYPAPGNPELAGEITALQTLTNIHADHDWGLDHGTWSVLLQMYPEADIPVLQLSMDRTKSPEFHLKLAQDLQVLREKGVLILGSGNIVHNLRYADFRNSQPYDWAIEFDQYVAGKIREKDHGALVNYLEMGNAAQLSVPTNEHYLPLLYALGLQESGEEVHFFNEEISLRSASMRSFWSGV